ncbi:hypothetical protein OG871_09565 [Kitasatospora sp. NBC_00374]|uniref:hypothetical protein n=1 Tax=Kitasatospora sp. NBC_00374 TaxID=2975964 RepID=UPI0032454B76
MSAPVTPARPPAPQAPGGAGRPPLRPAPWVLTRLRATPLAAVLSAVLAFTVVLLATALPRALDRGADGALHSYLARSGPAGTSLLATAASASGGSAQDLDVVLGRLTARTGHDFRLDPSGPVHGARALKPRRLTNPELARPDGLPPTLTLAYVAEAPSHVRLVEGRWPSGRPGPDGAVPVALATAAAKAIGAGLGAVLDGGTNMDGRQLVQVVGLYAADPADEVWTGLPCLLRACLNTDDDIPPRTFWQTAALVGPESLPALRPWGVQSEDFWRLPVDTGALRADRLAGTAREIRAFVAGPTATELTRVTARSDLRITSVLPDLLERAQARQSATAPLTASGPAGAAGVAAVVLCLAAVLTTDRRAQELRLLRARGGSRAGILRRLLGEGAVTVLPAAAAATGLALLLLPTPRWTAALAAALATTVLALLAFPARAVGLLGDRSRPAGWRRVAAEALVLAVTAAAVSEVRRRGVAPAGEGPDPLLVAAPLLLALTGALLLARLQPLLIGALARAAGRRPGAVGFLGLARAARGGDGRRRPSLLPQLALVLAVTTAGFGATVLASVDTARLQAARVAVGGDAEVTAAPGTDLPEAFLTAAAALPGVRTATAVRTDDGVTMVGADGVPVRATLVVVDPVSYAELARTVGVGRFDPALLAAAGGPSDPVPALVTRDLANRQAAGAHSLRLPGRADLPVVFAGVVDGTPALPGGSGATVLLPVGPAATRLAQLAHPNGWFGLGAIDDAGLRRLAHEAGVSAEDPERSVNQVHTSAAKVAELSADSLQRTADRLFRATVAGAAGFALLSVLLGLVRAAPERAALLARLRTMGLRPRQAVALLLAEALPQALVATVGGAVTAVAAVALLGPAVDLSSMVGTPVPTGLRPAVLPVLVQALAVAALTTVGVLAEAAVRGRRQITTELRAGDSR